MFNLKTLFQYSIQTEKSVSHKPAETVPGIREWGRAGERVNLSMTYLLHCKNFLKYYYIS
jgi:hypothetical protein